MASPLLLSLDTIRAQRSAQLAQKRVDSFADQAAKLAAAARAEAAAMHELADDLETMQRIRGMNSAHDLVAAAFFSAMTDPVSR